MITARAAQRHVLRYRGGKMAISAVPGSGKTMTLSLLAVELIKEHGFGAGLVERMRERLQEERFRRGEARPAEGGDAGIDAPHVLIVTFSNAGVANFKGRISRLLSEEHMPRHAGYDVRTLHSLSLWILQQDSAEQGLDPESLSVLQEMERNRILADVARLWLSGRAELADELFGKDVAGDWQRRRVLFELATAVIRNAKMVRLTPAALLYRLAALDESPEVLLARAGAELYDLYQTRLSTQGAADFDDLIWMAYDLLLRNDVLLARLRRRWPYILEDEAQDSSPLQERILSLLTGTDGNWVRVGDPNQAINATFTSAEPRYFRAFCRRDDVELVRLEESGRSALPIIHLANALVRWTCEEYPLPTIRERAFEYQLIRPVKADDPQPNPPAEEGHVALTREFATWKQEVEWTVDRALGYTVSFPDRTVAILTPTNALGIKVVQELSRRGAEYDDLLRGQADTRETLRLLAAVVSFAAEPHENKRLVELFDIISEMRLLDLPAGVDPGRLASLLRGARVEAFLFPEPGTSRREALPQVEWLDEELLASLDAFADRSAAWVRASLLPIDEFLLTVAVDLFPSSHLRLALAQQVAMVMRRAVDVNPSWEWPDFVRELADLASEARGLQPMGLSELGYTPAPGRVAVATMHGAKGLEWDLVYALGADKDWFCAYPEEVYVRRFGMMEGSEVEEIAALIRAFGDADQDFAPSSRPGSPTDEARVDLIAERLRLLYVVITRARRHLSISWSKEKLTGSRTGEDRTVETDISPILAELRRLVAEGAVPMDDGRASA